MKRCAGGPGLIFLSVEEGERHLAHLKRPEALQADRQGPYWNPSDPGHQAARAEWTRCYELVYGTRRVG